MCNTVVLILRRACSVAAKEAVVHGCCSHGKDEGSVSCAGRWSRLRSLSSVLEEPVAELREE